LTQFALSARHAVRQGGDDKTNIAGLRGLRQFLEVPASFANKATLSSIAGTVGQIDRAPQGGSNVFVGKESYYIPPNLTTTVRVGQQVLPGDVLSDGIPSPKEIVQFKGLGSGRKYVVDRLYDVYQNQGLDLDKRHLEVLARAQLNHVQVDEDPKDQFTPGEIVNFALVQKRLADGAKTVRTQDAKDYILAENRMYYTAGTQVTSQVVEDLLANGIKSVKVAINPPTLSFVMSPITSNPLLNPDWMARLGHRKLKQTIQEAAQYGQRTDIHGTHPVPAYVHGVEFGRGPKGRY
jgi:hypothetical protein